MTDTIKTCNHARRFTGVAGSLNGCIACHCEAAVADAQRWREIANGYEKQLVEIANCIGKDATDPSGNSIAEVAIAEMGRLKAGQFTPEEFENICHSLPECRDWLPSPEWIPLPPAPGGRLPTEEDARIYQCEKEPCILVHSQRSGYVGPQSLKNLLLEIKELGDKSDIFEWMPLPAPYVPPPVPEPEKRREWWFDGTPKAHERNVLCCPPNAVVHDKSPESGGLSGGIHVREVLPGDIDPDAARNLVEWIEQESKETLTFGSTLLIDKERLTAELAACRVEED